MQKLKIKTRITSREHYYLKIQIIEVKNGLPMHLIFKVRYTKNAEQVN